MGKGSTKKKGPPYKLPSGEKYIVVLRPWGMKPGHQRSDLCANNVGGWLRIMLHDLMDEDDTIFPEVIYTQTTKDAIIVQLPKEADIDSLVGIHHWTNFLVPFYGGQEESHIFIYDYVHHGDPGTHNWTARYPTSGELPSNFPIKSPYPHPTGVPQLTVDFALPITEQKKAELNAKLSAQVVKENDSYKEETAHNSLSQSLVKEEPDTDPSPSIYVKQELVDDYQPSSELLASLATLPSQHFNGGSQVQSLKVKPEKDEYVPSQDLVDVFEKYQSIQQSSSLETSSPHVKSESQQITSRAEHPPAVSHDPRIRSKDSSALKRPKQEEREPELSGLAGPSSPKKIKREWD